MPGPYFFGIYLNDHLAILTAGIELAERSLSNNRTGTLGELLARLSGSMQEDGRDLRALLSRNGTPPHPLKLAAAKVGERIGRLKPNGQLTGYSDLSRVVELEGLSAITHLRVVFWRTVGALDGADDLLSGEDRERRVTNAEQQLRAIEKELHIAAERAFVTRPGA